MCSALKSSFGFLAFIYFSHSCDLRPPIPPPRLPASDSHLCFAASGIWKIKLCSSYFFFICFSLYTYVPCTRACTYMCMWCVWLVWVFGFLGFLTKQELCEDLCFPPLPSVIPRLSVFPQL